MGEQDRLRLSDAQVAQLAALLDGKGRRTLLLETQRGRLRVDVAPDRPPLDSVAGSDGVASRAVAAATVGTFLSAHPASPAVALVHPGDQIQSGALLGFIRVGILLTPVVFDAAPGGNATLVQVLVRDGAPVEYGTKLFSVAQR